MPGPAPSLRRPKPRSRRLAGVLLLVIAVPVGLWAGAYLARLGPAAEAPAEPVWVLVARSAGVELYLDTASIARDGALRRVIERQDLAAPDPDGVRSRRYRNEYDCASRRHRIGSVTSHAEPGLAGKRLFAIDEQGYWRAVPRGSLFERALGAVCADPAAATAPAAADSGTRAGPADAEAHR